MADLIPLRAWLANAEGLGTKNLISEWEHDRKNIKKKNAEHGKVPGGTGVRIKTCVGCNSPP
jgi:hypothetical protein